MLDLLLASAIATAASPCISIERLSPVVNISVFEITQVESVLDKGSSFIWKYIDGSYTLMSFTHEGCVWRADALRRDLAEYIIQFAGDGI